MSEFRLETHQVQVENCMHALQIIADKLASILPSVKQLDLQVNLSRSATIALDSTCEGGQGYLSIFPLAPRVHAPTVNKPHQMRSIYQFGLICLDTVVLKMHDDGWLACRSPS